MENEANSAAVQDELCVGRHREDHHFLLPRDGTTYAFLAGTYKVEIFGVVVGNKRPVKLTTIELSVSDTQAARLRDDKSAGLYFDWSPETGRYQSHLDNARPRDPAPFFMLSSGDSKPESARQLQPVRNHTNLGRSHRQ